MSRVGFAMLTDAARLAGARAGRMRTDEGERRFAGKPRDGRRVAALARVGLR